MATQSSGVTFLPQLKREHVELTSFSRMRVGLAAQVKYVHTYIFYYNVTLGVKQICS